MRDSIYVDPERGDDADDGLSPERPKKTFAAAYALSWATDKPVMKSVHAPPMFTDCWAAVGRGGFDDKYLPDS